MRRRAFYRDVRTVDLSGIHLELRQLQKAVRQSRIRRERAFRLGERARGVAGPLERLRGHHVQLRAFREGRQPARQRHFAFAAKYLEIGDVERRVLRKPRHPDGSRGQGARRLTVGAIGAGQARIELGLRLRRRIACKEFLADRRPLPSSRSSRGGRANAASAARDCPRAVPPPGR